MSLAAVDTKRKLPDLDRVPRVDEVGVNERVARFQIGRASCRERV